MKKNLLTNPIRLSQPAGAALAFLGINETIPLWHGVQGCTAFAKILYISHFREPMPLSTSALSQSSVIMGGDDNALTALKVLNSKAKLLGLLTTGVAETSGVDLKRLVKDFEPDAQGVKVVAVSTPDYEGSLETGYVKAVKAILKTLVAPKIETTPGRVAIFMGPYFTPGDVEELRDQFELFGLDPIFVPDLGDSMNGYLSSKGFTPCTWGGTSVQAIESLANVEAIFSIGASMEELSQKFATQNDLPHYHYNHLATLEELDHFYLTLQTLSGKAVPKKLLRERSHLQDTFLDVEYYFYHQRAVICGDSDLIKRWQAPLEALGIQTRPACSIRTKEFDETDLSDVAEWCENGDVEMLFGNSHTAKMGEGLGLAVIRCGIPVEDRIGEPQRVRVGYRGTANLYRECVNALLKAPSKHKAYISDLQSTLVESV